MGEGTMRLLSGTKKPLSRVTGEGFGVRAVGVGSEG
jgi:hypothetical protein